MKKPPNLARLSRWLTFVPETIAPEQRRAYYVALLVAGVGGLFHLLILVLFSIYDITPLVYANVGSVAFFVAVFFLVHQTGRAALGMVLVSVELITHQVLAVYYLGWDYGFQYYLLFVTALVFFGHYRRLAAPTLCAALSLIALGWLYFHGQYLHLPHLSMPEPVRVGLFWWNVFGIGLGFAVMSSVYARTAARMERELAEQNQELRETQAMLVQSEKMAAIGKLTAGLTHEINTPVGAILSSADTGARVVERLREQTTGSGDGKPLARLLDVLDQTIDSAGDAARRLSDMVRRLQSLVRIDEAEVKLADLHEGIESALSLLSDQTEAGRIEVICSFDRTIPQVLCRPAEINQVLMNLLQNAIDAIEGPGTVTITTSHDPEWVDIAVRDTGRGLKPEEREGLFDPSISSSRSRVKMGLGLAISHQIVVHHHGELRVESTPGEGSTFTLVLPKRTVAEPPP